MEYDVMSFGEVLIDMVSDQNVDRMEDVRSFLKIAGGAPANVAVGTSKLGLKSAFSGNVGADPMGNFLGETLESWGVDVSALERDDEHLTPLAFVSISHSGERDFHFYNHETAEKMIKFRNVAKSIAEQSRFFHFGSFAMASPSGYSATVEALNFLKANSNPTIVSFDPNIRVSVWESPEKCKQAVQVALPQTDVLKVSDEELGFLCKTPTDHELSISELLKAGPKMVVLSTGKKGCKIGTKQGMVSVPCFPHPPVDTTGAGDGFWSGVLFALSRKLQGVPDRLFDDLSDRDLYQIGIIGNAVGTIATQGKGAIPSYPTIDQLKQFLLEELNEESRAFLKIGWDELEHDIFIR